MKAYRKPEDLPQERVLKAQLGNFVARMRPELKEKVGTRPFSGEWGMAGRLVRNAIFLKAIEEEDHDQIQVFLNDYWKSSASDEFFDHFAHRFDTVFLKHHEGVIARIFDAMKQSGGEFDRFVEIGTGDGRVLKYVSERIEGISRFIGVDLNEAQILKNQKDYSEDANLEFEVGEALKWVGDHPAPGTVMTTNGGVCEYMTRAQLEAMLRKLTDAGGPCVVAITETLAIDHDLLNEPQSFPYGHEFAFSHNYRALLEEAGFEVNYVNDRYTVPTEEHHPSRWIQVVASCKH